MTKPQLNLRNSEPDGPFYRGPFPEGAIETYDLNREWRAALKKSTHHWWYSEHLADLPAKSLVEAITPTSWAEERRQKYVEDILTLREVLLEFGGFEVCFPSFESEKDLKALLTTGQAWRSRGLKMRRGRDIRCHANSALLWDANRDRLQIATGYALSKDGMWRQHSWCIEKRPRRPRVVETTLPRLCYFGDLLSLKESERFLIETAL